MKKLSKGDRVTYSAAEKFGDRVYKDLPGTVIEEENEFGLVLVQLDEVIGFRPQTSYERQVQGHPGEFKLIDG